MQEAVDVKDNVRWRIFCMNVSQAPRLRNVRHEVRANAKEVHDVIEHGFGRLCFIIRRLLFEAACRTANDLSRPCFLLGHQVHITIVDGEEPATFFEINRGERFVAQRRATFLTIMPSVSSPEPPLTAWSSENMFSFGSLPMPAPSRRHSESV